MATTPSAHHWLARVIAALTLLPQLVHQQRKSDGATCLLPPIAFPLPQAHTHTRTHAHDIGAYRAILPSRLLPNPLVTVRSSDIISLHSTGCLTLTLSAPGKERRARALVESHSLTCAPGLATALPATKCLGG
ncbi:hypothetical protein Q7P35_000984 [Cladosporium inversicolor]